MIYNWQFGYLKLISGLMYHNNYEKWHEIIILIILIEGEGLLSQGVSRETRSEHFLHLINW